MGVIVIVIVIVIVTVICVYIYIYIYLYSVCAFRRTPLRRPDSGARSQEAAQSPSVKGVAYDEIRQGGLPYSELRQRGVPYKKLIN